tara:strand:+ start:5476 stop:5661 length:186 start_codon:yes stop_codon:yes gene_type:complete
MTCAGCTNHVSSTLKKVSGVIEQSVQYPGDVAIIQFDTTKTNPEKLIKAIEKVSYEAEIVN